jgi:acetylornithine deacetylase/succinyl-diaminopimelate desuccinylase-like protein
VTTALPRTDAGLLGEAELRERVERLAGIPDRGSATVGEREAAEYIAGDLRDAGARSVTIETAPVHGTYWWPIGIPVAAATIGGLVGGRAGAILGALATASAVDDIKIGPRVLRRVLPKRETTNVIAEFGDPDGERIVLVTAHHDAAHSGLVFHPGMLRALPRRFPSMKAYDYTPPSMWTSVAGPALVALGSASGSRRLRRLGTFLSAGNVAAMVDIGRRAVVPGANDNATGVAVLQSLARRLAADPPAGTRVILLSAGSEESFMEGMAAFAARHFPDLPRERTKVITLDTVGSPKLAVLRGEGMLGVRDYSAAMHDLMTSCADELGLDAFRELRFRNATDGLIAMNAGYETTVIASADEFKIGTDYHWPTDTADRIDYGTVADAARLCSLAIDRIACAARPGS